MKVAVYAISLNEEKNVRSWAESAKEADVRLIADTGSTDNTVAVARECGVDVIEINVIPWRFDVARTAALAALPADVDWCIVLDMDERLDEGWREALEKVPAGVTRVLSNYIWSWNPDGTPGHRYMRDHIHRRVGYRWRRAVHEEPTPYGSVQEVRAHAPDLHCHHEPDYTKTTRKQYLPLMRIAVAEEPDDSQLQFWFARELYYHGDNEESIAEFKKLLASPTATWAPERSASMYYLSLLEPGLQVHWLKEAEKTSPQRREHKFRLAEHYYQRQDWGPCLYWADKALAITWVPEDYLNIPQVWGPELLEFKYMSLWNLGRRAEAVESCKLALALAPDSKRIQGNLRLMQDRE